MFSIHSIYYNVTRIIITFIDFLSFKVKKKIQTTKYEKNPRVIKENPISYVPGNHICISLPPTTPV